MVEERLKVVIVFDDESHLYEVFSKSGSLIDDFTDLDDCLDFCKERNFQIIDSLV